MFMDVSWINIKYLGDVNVIFQPAGIPDSPDECILLNVTDRQATIQCEQGYDGGEKATFTFMVKKSTPHQSPTEVTSTFIWKQDALAEISVSELEPNNNYTLLVYQENKYGHSSSSFGVLTNTLGMYMDCWLYAATCIIINIKFIYDIHV